ncbi:MAG: OB-fold domain-containing protein [Rhodococcus sp. (in: high G+C Gram-positive bacteria)]
MLQESTPEQCKKGIRVDETITSRAAEITARGASARRRGRDPVNRPMVNTWLEGLGFEADPQRAVPEAMIQVWTMGGLHGRRAADDPLGAMMSALDDEGFTSVVATDCNQTYRRAVDIGADLSVSTVLESVVGPKKTAVGEGWFVTTRNTWFDGDDPVAEMTFKVLKFAPRVVEVAAADSAPVPTSGVLRPVISPDSAFFWEGTAQRELRVQQMGDGSLRHPPIPRVDTDPAAPVDHQVMSGKGVVHSYVVHHHPAVPGRRTPFVVALVQLDEGPRMLGELRGIEGDSVRIGMAVEVDFDRIDDALTIPYWRVANIARAERARDRGVEIAVGDTLPPMTVHADPTFVVSSALATRDFQDVHHDRDKAIARGSKDIFVNILTDTGLVQRFVEEWAGGDTTFTAISLRLGVPWYAYDTVTFTGEVTDVRESTDVRSSAVAGTDVTLRVIGSNSLGKHIVGTVIVTLAGKATS